jgi:NAD(P)-dependent dehydrogenase (short-subunit alcohol dehydrogenase family)
MDKTAVVTGGNRGIGLEISKQLAARGIITILTSRNMHEGRPLVNELRKQWKNIWYHQLDVTDETSIRDILAYLEDDCGKLDILINNAGIVLNDDKNILEMDPALIRETLNTNLYGPLRLIQAFMPMLKQSEDARIINLSSTMGQLSSMGSSSPAYRISKTALNALSVILSAELAGSNIKVNSVCPGWVKTDMGGEHASLPAEEGADTAVWLATADEIPNGKFIRGRKVISW